MTLSTIEVFSRPLVVDLDGTFLKTDILWETVLATFKKDPRRLLAACLALPRGRAGFKLSLIGDSALDVGRFPVAEEVLEFVKQRKQAGQRIILATGTAGAAAQAIARLYPFFDEVLSTQGNVNLVGRTKGLELENRFGKEGFDYIGNALADLQVWSRCHTAFYYNAHWVTRQLLRATHARSMPVGDSGRASTWTFGRAMRMHQWAKNLLIPLPFIAAHQALTAASALQLLRGVLAFNFAASAAYLLNDLVDIEHDRGHPSKRHRPVASGHFSIPSSIGVACALIALAVLLVQGLPELFIALLAGYFVLTCCYSLWLKRVVLLDVIVLAGLYVWRLLAGGALMDVTLSRWFLVFSVFLFFSLALVKRCSELFTAKARGIEHAAGRGYKVTDLPQLSQFGSASGLLAALVYCLYIASPEVTKLYRHPEWLWMGLPILLFWICRLWLLTGHGEVHEDPLIFTLKDPYSYAVGVLMAVVVYTAV